MAGNLTAMIASIFSGGVTADPYFEYTTLLLPGNGTNGKNNNEFLDSSTNNFTITRNPLTGPNAPTQGTFSPFSQTGWGNFATATSGSVGFSCTTASLVGQTASTFTAECWIYMTEAPVSGDGVPSLIGMDAAYNSSVYLGFGPNASRVLVLRWFDGASKTVTGSTTLALNTWYHVAVVANSNALAMYVNGNLETLSGTTTLTNRNGTTTDFSLLLNSSASNYQFRGYVSNIRVCTSAVYTTPFTPSTLPLTTTSQGATNCQLLTAQDNRFIDKSSNGYLLVALGSPSVVAFSPFNPTASWSAATNGGSGYFDGSGDYLNTASNAAFTLGSSGDFTVEMFFYAPAAQATNTILISTMNNGTSDFVNRWGIQFVTSTTLGWYNDAGSNGITSGTVVLSQWNHLAVCRSGSTIRMWLNGVSQGTQTTNQAYTTQGSVKVGFLTGLAAFSGYISDVRVVKGTAVYDASSSANITVPTAPLTAITNTSLLLNFTNAGIYDATSKNNLETVGNASISNTTAQFGATSITFNGTTGYMTAPASSLFNFGTGDFTIEAWVYASSLATRVIFSNSSGSGTNNITFYITSNGKINANNFGVAPISSIDSITAGTWNYVAIIKSSGVYTFYINGSISGVYAGLGSSNNLTDGYCTVGARPGPSDLWSGYIQDLRITKGYARNIAASPTAAFPTL